MNGTAKILESAMSNEIHDPFEQYWERLKKRNPQPGLERGYRCLCCRDTGLIPTHIILRQLSRALPSVCDEIQVLGGASTPVACSRSDCKGFLKKCDDGQWRPGYTPDSVINISPELCQMVHSQEAQTLKEGGSSEASVQLDITKIGRVMPDAS